VSCFTTPQLFQRGRNWGKTEWEAGFPRWWEMGGIGKNYYSTLCNILHSKKCTRAGASKKGRGTRIKGYPPSPPHPRSLIKMAIS